MATKTLNNPTPAKQIHVRPVIKVPQPKVTINPGDGERAIAMAVEKMVHLMNEIATINARIMNQQTDERFKGEAMMRKSPQSGA